MKLQQLLSPVRKAVDDYHMIEDGDRIAIGISGGKDSLTLLYALSYLQRFYPKSFKLIAVTVDPGFSETFRTGAIQNLCETLHVPYYVVSTEIAGIIEKHPESSPCSLCARLRKGAFNQRILELGCNKIAYAHHMDDVIETMLMSLIYEGRFSTFSPVTHLERSGLTLIRPMIYVSEAHVIGFRNRYNLPVEKNPCPNDGYTKRTYIKQLIRSINQQNPGVKQRLFTAICNGTLPDWQKDFRNDNKEDFTHER